MPLPPLKIRVGAAAEPGKGFYSKCTRRWVPVDQISIDLLRNSSLIMPEFSRDNGTTILKYAGIVDIDAALGDAKKDTIRAITDMPHDTPITHPAIHQTVQHARDIASAFGAPDSLIFFTGSKGVRVLVPPTSTALFVRVQDSQSYGQSILDSVVRPAIGAHADILDACVYDPAKGVKPDVHPHPTTGAWPSTCLRKSTAEDPAVSLSIVDFWKSLAAFAQSIDIDSVRQVQGPTRTSRKRSAPDSYSHPPSVKSVLAEISQPTKKIKGAHPSTFHELHPWGANYFRPADGAVRRTIVNAKLANTPMVINEIVPPCTRFFIDVDNIDAMPESATVCRIVKDAWNFASPVTVLKARGEKKSYHLIWYKLFVSREAALATRNILVAQLASEFPDTDWNTHIDPAVYNTSLRIVGSDKELKTPDGAYKMAGRELVHHADISPDGITSTAKRPFAAVLYSTLLGVPGATPADPPPQVQNEIVSSSHSITSTGPTILTTYELVLAEYICNTFLPQHGPYNSPKPIGQSPIVCLSTTNRQCPIAQKEHKTAQIYLLCNTSSGKTFVKCWKCAGQSVRVL